MDYRLIAVDVDGTLLDSHEKLQEETIQAIKKGVRHGLRFVISTGRPLQGVKPLMQTIGVPYSAITYNGAMVLDESLQTIFQCTLPVKEAISIYQLGEKEKVRVTVWANHQLYANRIDEITLDYGKISSVRPQQMIDICEVAKAGITKILWIDTEESISQYQRDLNGTISNTVNFHTSRPHFLEFVDATASKALAMEKLGAAYGIKKEAMVAVGDGLNDLSMIEYAGLGVAMANAHPDVLACADIVTESNDQNGVGRLMDRLIDLK